MLQVSDNLIVKFHGIWNYRAQYYTASWVDDKKVVTILQEPREVLTTTATTNKLPQEEDPDRVAKDWSIRRVRNSAAVRLIGPVGIHRLC